MTRVDASRALVALAVLASPGCLESHSIAGPNVSCLDLRGTWRLDLACDARALGRCTIEQRACEVTLYCPDDVVVGTVRADTIELYHEGAFCQGPATSRELSASCAAVPEVGACRFEAARIELVPIPRAPHQDAIEDLADVFCTRLASCSPTLFGLQYATRAECFASQVERLDWLATLPGTTAGAAELDACAAALGAAACEEALLTEVPACRAPGTRPLGASCLAAEQCASGLCTANGFTCGVCAPTPVPGSECQRAEECGNWLTCERGRCQELLLVGAACTTDDSTRACRPGSRCVGGACVAGASVAGSPCAGDVDQCDVFAGFVCRAERCEPLELLELGTTCDDESLTLCAGGVSCGVAGGRCRPTPRAGEPCLEGSIPCLPPAVCSDDVCVGAGNAPTCE